MKNEMNKKQLLLAIEKIAKNNLHGVTIDVTHNGKAYQVTINEKA